MGEPNVKILVIRFSSIGDIVLTAPVIRCLKEQLEGNIEIHYLLKKRYEQLLIHNPNISKIYTINDDINEVIQELKKEQYDYIIDLHKNLRSRRVITRLNGLSFTFKKLNYQKWLITNLNINRLPEVHLVDRYMEAVKALGVENDHKGLEYFISGEDRIDLKDLPLSHQKGYITYAIGGQHEGKKLPQNKIIEICKKVNLPMVLLGGKEDCKVAFEVFEEIGENIYVACGEYNINQSASLVEQANVVITHDTGLMHIAAAFKRRSFHYGDVPHHYLECILICQTPIQLS